MMRPGDVRQVVVIEAASTVTPWTRRMFMAELGRRTSLDLVVVRGAWVLGYAMVTRYADVWHILNLCVDSAQRERGLLADTRARPGNNRRSVFQRHAVFRHDMLSIIGTVARRHSGRHDSSALSAVRM